MTLAQLMVKLNIRVVLGEVSTSIPIIDIHLSCLDVDVTAGFFSSFYMRHFLKSVSSVSIPVVVRFCGYKSKLVFSIFWLFSVDHGRYVLR